MTQWTKIIEECSQRPSGMTIAERTTQHGIGEKTYYYWQRKVRCAMAQLVNPQLPAEVPTQPVAFFEIKYNPEPTVTMSMDMFRPEAVLRKGDMLIGISNSLSEKLLRVILEDVSHVD